MSRPPQPVPRLTRDYTSRGLKVKMPLTGARDWLPTGYERAGITTSPYSAVQIPRTIQCSPDSSMPSIDIGPPTSFGVARSCAAIR